MTHTTFLWHEVRVCQGIKIKTQHLADLITRLDWRLTVLDVIGRVGDIVVVVGEDKRRPEQGAQQKHGNTSPHRSSSLSRQGNSHAWTQHSDWRETMPSAAAARSPPQSNDPGRMSPLVRTPLSARGQNSACFAPTMENTVLAQEVLSPSNEIFAFQITCKKKIFLLFFPFCICEARPGQICC